MSAMLRSALVVTAFTLVAQLVNLVGQALVAHEVGSSVDGDAFFAASTLPQYVGGVLAGAVAIVFIPGFMRARERDGEGGAWRFATSAVLLCALLLLIIVSACLIATKPLLRATVPGMSEGSLQIATRLAILFWPSAAATVLVALLTSLYQIEAGFSWASFVPVLGALANLGLLAFLLPAVGIEGAAIATTLSVTFQVAFLSPIIFRHRRDLAIDWKDPALIATAWATVPLVASAIFVRSTVVIDRYFASQLSDGSIAHLGYASRIITALGAAVSAGLGAVLFPPLAEAIAKKDVVEFRETASRSLRVIWLIVAPVMTIGIALAVPLIALLFERGAFTSRDSAAVGALLQIYLLSLIPIALATVTSRAIYSLQATRLVALVGALEAIVYLGYTLMLARAFGVMGIAASFVIYYIGSLLWQIAYLRKATAGRGLAVAKSLATTTALATVSGLVAWRLGVLVEAPLASILVGGAGGLAVYGLALVLLRPPELVGALAALRRRERARVSER